MKYDLTVLVPGIRTENWKRLFRSVQSSFSGTFEMIFISPYPLPESLKYTKDVRLINDWGTPIRCQQRGLIEAKGEWITWAADDGEFMPGALDIGFKTLSRIGIARTSLIMGKYHEGDNKDNHKFMSSNEYYVLSTHESMRLKYLPKEYYMLNVGIVARDLLIDVGGWDCQFEVCPLAYNDLAIRLQRMDINFIIQDEIMFKCNHLPGHAGDHGPIHDAQTLHDHPLFDKMYKDKSSEKRIVIPLDNWKQSPERWERRFGKN